VLLATIENRRSILEDGHLEPVDDCPARFFGFDQQTLRKITIVRIQLNPRRFEKNV
jgi:hypothetical protein